MLPCTVLFREPEALTLSFGSFRRVELLTQKCEGI